MKQKFEVKHTVGGAFNLNYHLVWTTAFNRKVLTDEISDYIKEVALEAAEKIEVEVHLFEVLDGHYVNCLLSAPPKISVTVEDDCWIGSNVTILDGVTIGKGSVIGAGTLVTKDIAAGSVVVDKREKSIRQR